MCSIWDRAMVLTAEHKIQVARLVQLRPLWGATAAASENLGSWLAASLPYEAMTSQAVILHEGTSQNWFGQASEAA